MKERIQKFIDYKGISPGELSEILEVQRSNISHILNGRNKPGAVFIEKFLLAFPSVNARWLFTGEGSMLIGEDSASEPKPIVKEVKREPEIPFATEKKEAPVSPKKNVAVLEKVVLLYSDGTFVSYNAGGKDNSF
ncbi:hypothetical protein SAMN05444274_101220 [Mariniphaga anaerophila]|uniref:HTH cro/C1-type domain-containing protein n=1 Tax=Mariniphaga anaerophila TaxID=1484053 RepID=A0A1M4T0U9_9BACT|nr:helix-turn-helix transcriptional regulator [Mariniphaga anaerophila]SHE38088.1 hypothetical protein SAMN05444274_101220 [Mariniphaga anaerophila]